MYACFFQIGVGIKMAEDEGEYLDEIYSRWRCSLAMAVWEINQIRKKLSRYEKQPFMPEWQSNSTHQSPLGALTESWYETIKAEEEKIRTAKRTVIRFGILRGNP